MWWERSAWGLTVGGTAGAAVSDMVAGDRGACGRVRVCGGGGGGGRGGSTGRASSGSGPMGVDLVAPYLTDGDWRGPGHGTRFPVGVRYNEWGQAVACDGVVVVTMRFGRRQQGK